MVKIYLLCLGLIFTVFKSLNAEESNLHPVSLPFLDWYLQLDLKDFAIKKDLLSVDATKRFIEAKGSADSNFILSIHMEQYSDSKDCKKCRIYYIHKLKPVFVPDYETLITEKGDTAYWEFFVKNYEGKTVNHKNLNLVYARDSVCINIHISKLNYSDSDKLVFDELSNGIKFLRKSRKISPEMIELYSKFSKTQAEPLRREIMNSSVSLIGMLAYIHSLDSISDKFRMIDKFISEGPENGIEFAHFEKGVLYVVDEDFAKAVEELTKSIEINDDNFLLFHFRGMSYNKLANYYAAITDLTKAVKLEPSSVHPYMQRAESYWNLKDYENSIADYTSVINTDNKVADAYVYRGVVYNETGKYEKAVKDWKKAVELSKEWEKELKPMIEKAELEINKGR